MARPRSTGYAGQLEQILAAAARHFATRGYTATTMNDVAAACGVSKATLYHYVRDKQDLLAHITAGHVARLEALVLEVAARPMAPEARLRQLIHRFMQAYAGAQDEHRVLTEDVKFLHAAERERVLEAQRRVVAAVADAVAALRPDLGAAQLHKPLALLLFGMINWTFTWLRAGGTLSHGTLAPVVEALFFGGLPAVVAPAPSPRSPGRPHGSGRAPAPGPAPLPAPVRPRRRPRPG
ncbi:MAG: TetR/AcrR family transcriptional regulator [Betaproteobacteria bacterium]|nr:TetR/AcrR family transcriptional regulator [Betaproteobacteria bacterium]